MLALQNEQLKRQTWKVTVVQQHNKGRKLKMAENSPNATPSLARLYRAVNSLVQAARRYDDNIILLEAHGSGIVLHAREDHLLLTTTSSLLCIAQYDGIRGLKLVMDSGQLFWMRSDRAVPLFPECFTLAELLAQQMISSLGRHGGVRAALCRRNGDCIDGSMMLAPLRRRRLVSEAADAS